MNSVRQSGKRVNMTDDPLEREFRTNSTLQHCEIMVVHDNGTMVLTGTVASFYLKQMAQEVAKRAIQRSGISVQVRNDLKVP